MELPVARDGEAIAGDAVLLEVAGDGDRPGGRELPVRRELRAVDRDVVRVPLDAQAARRAREERCEPGEGPLRGGRERRLPLGEEDRALHPDEERSEEHTSEL